MTTQDIALRFAGVDKRFRRRWALRDCSLALPRGRVAALVGPNGAGKSTLLMLIAGLLRPTAGRIDVLGARPASAGVPAGLSFLAQGKPLYLGFRVAEMLRAGAALNAGGRWDAGYVARLVEDAGIGPDDRIRDLSPGSRSRVALALALGRRPELLLLDEPMAELDPLARKQVMATLLAEVAETGTTVLMSSHVLADVEDACDHLVLLRDGRVRIAGAVEDLLAGHQSVLGPGPGLSGVPAGQVVFATTSGRQTTAVIRDAAAPPGFLSWPASLDELVLAYLQESRTAADVEVSS